METVYSHLPNTFYYVSPSMSLTLHTPSFLPHLVYFPTNTPFLPTSPSLPLLSHLSLSSRFYISVSLPTHLMVFQHISTFPSNTSSAFPSVSPTSTLPLLLQATTSWPSSPSPSTPYTPLFL